MLSQQNEDQPVMPCLYPVWRNKRVGLINSSGQLVVGFQFDGVAEFYNGVAAFDRGGHSGFIGADGHIRIEAKFDAVSHKFVDGLVPVRLGNRWGYADVTGDVVIEALYEKAFEFSEGRATVRTADGWRIIDTTGKIVITDCMGCITNSFSCGRKKIESGGPARFLEDGCFGFMDRHGVAVIQPNYQQSSEHFSEDRAYVKWKGYYGSIDIDGRYVVEPQYAWMMDFREGIAFFRGTSGSLWGAVQSDGQIAFSPRFHDESTFYEGMARATYDGEMYGFCDCHGDMVIPPRFELVEEFHSGRAVFTKGRKQGYIDQNGNIIVPAIYNHAYPFNGELARVIRGDRSGYVNREGNEVWSTK